MVASYAYGFQSSTWKFSKALNKILAKPFKMMNTQSQLFFSSYEEGVWNCCPCLLPTIHLFSTNNPSVDFFLNVSQLQFLFEILINVFSIVGFLSQSVKILSKTISFLCWGYPLIFKSLRLEISTLFSLDYLPMFKISWNYFKWRRNLNDF